MALRQPRQGRVQQPGRRGLGGAVAGVELGRQHPVALRPGHQLGLVAEPALVVEGRPLLLAAVHLGGGGVDVQRHRRRGIEPQIGVEDIARLGGGGQGGPQLGHRQPSQPLPRRGWRRGPRHRPQPGPGPILAQHLEMRQVVASRHHRLGQRHRQLAGAPPSPPLLEGPDPLHRPVDPGHQPGAPDQLPQQQQPGEAGEMVIVGADVDPGGGCGTMHLKSASSWGMSGSCSPRYSHTGQALFFIHTLSSKRLTSIDSSLPAD